MVTIREDGVERRVTAAEAFLLQLAKRGLEGDGPAARATLAVIEERTDRPSNHHAFPASSSGGLWHPGASHLHCNRCEWPGNWIPTARPPEWPSNRGSLRPRWPTSVRYSVLPISGQS
jgi:hypothetical protein